MWHLHPSQVRLMPSVKSRCRHRPWSRGERPGSGESALGPERAPWAVRSPLWQKRQDGVFFQMQNICKMLSLCFQIIVCVRQQEVNTWRCDVCWSFQKNTSYTMEKTWACGPAEWGWAWSSARPPLPCPETWPCRRPCLLLVIFLFDTKAPCNKNWVPRLPSARVGVLHSALLVPRNAPAPQRGFRGWGSRGEDGSGAAPGLLQSFEVPAYE